MPGSADSSRVGSLADLALFARQLGTEAAGAENPTTERFLEALAAWIEDSYVGKASPPPHGIDAVPSWNVFAIMLTAALEYE